MSGRQAMLAKLVIDASGDGDVAARAGAPFWHTRHNEANRLNDQLMYRIEFGADAPLPNLLPAILATIAVVWGPATAPTQQRRRG